ncbi:MAG: hypothetical protein ACFCUR_05155 [Rhodomicrobiaceae bacterium]
MDGGKHWHHQWSFALGPRKKRFQVQRPIETREVRAVNSQSRPDKAFSKDWGAQFGSDKKANQFKKRQLPSPFQEVSTFPVIWL